MKQKSNPCTKAKIASALLLMQMLTAALSTPARTWRRYICQSGLAIVTGESSATARKGGDIIIAFLLFVLFAVVSCRTPRSVSESSQNSTLISERYDSALMIAGDSANAALLFRCDSLGNVYLANLITEQGRRIRLELLLQGAINQRDSLFRALSGTNASSTEQLTTATPKQPKNTPLLLQIDCKEDSFETVVRGLRERIAYYENNKQRVEVPVQYIPDFYRNCTRGFWTLLVLIIIALALIIWKNWSSIAAWAIKTWAKFKF